MSLHRILHRWKKNALSLLFLVSVVLALHQTVIYFRYFDWENAKKLGMHEYGAEFYWELSERDMLYLYGDPKKESNEERWRAAVEAYPDDPAVYWRYSVNAEQLPEDFRETVDRIAPENGFFDYLEALECASKVFESKRVKNVTLEPRSDQSRKRRRVSWETVNVIHEDQIDRIIELLEEVVRKPELSDYEAEGRRGVLERIPEHVDWVTQWNSGIPVFYFGGIELPKSQIHQILHYRASKAVESGDREEFLELFELGDALSKRLASPSSNYYSRSSALAKMLDDAKFYQEGARSLGLTEMADTLKKREEYLAPHFGEALRESRWQAPSHPLEALASRHFLPNGAEKYLEGKYDIEDHRPMARTLDAFVAWQKSLQIFWICPVLILLLATYCFCQCGELKKHSRQLAGAVSVPKIVFLSSILPSVIFLAIHFLKASWNSEPDPG